MASTRARVHEDGDGITIGGWRVRATSAPIIGDAAVEAACRTLGGALVVPEILFGNSGLELRHEPSGVALSFDALDALAAWRREDLAPLKVGLAAAWQAARRAEIERQRAAVLSYDWTFTTPYLGTVVVDGGGGAAAASAAEEQQQSQQQQSQQQQSQQKQQQQRIVCTSLTEKKQSPEAAAKAHAAATSAADAGGACAPTPAAVDGSAGGQGESAKQAGEGGEDPWVPTTLMADRALLTSRDEPILFFREVPLYESELDDNGAIQLSVKVRVMSRCWLVLLRFWLRVDGSLVRLREARYFARFDGGGGNGGGTALILRETKHFEATMEQLRAAGAPTAATAYPDGDAVAAVFNAIAPAGLARFELHELRLPLLRPPPAAGNP